MMLRIFAIILIINTCILIPTSTHAQKNINKEDIAPNITAVFLDSIAKSHSEIYNEPQSKLIIDLLSNSDTTTSKLRLVTEYENLFMKYKKSSLKGYLKEHGGSIALLGLLLFLIFKSIIRKLYERISSKIVDFIWPKIGGLMLFNIVSQNKYQNNILEIFSVEKSPFRPEKPLNLKNIYIPIRIGIYIANNPEETHSTYDNNKYKADIEDQSRSQAELFAGVSTSTTNYSMIDEIIRQYNHIVITGSPGSGKSMLLKHIAVRCFEKHSNFHFKKKLPILFNLNRLNSKKTDLLNNLAEELERNGFTDAMPLLLRKLDRGEILLLLDGLDEVRSEHKSKFIIEIEDLITSYRDCPVILTCRTAIYHNEMARCMDVRAVLGEFNDIQIEGFLKSWKFPENKSANELIKNLSERPKLIYLARNPLMLTMIAFLYSRPIFTLPLDRYEFYNDATRLLLELKVLHNKFKLIHKQSILRQMALAIQDGGTATDDDKATIKAGEAVNIASNVLAGFGLSNDNSAEVLDEIIDRSGLLLRIDDGEKLKFAHLTLQEFYAANALRDYPDDLIDRFMKDKDNWYEVINLWCAIDHNSTQFIKRLIGVDKVAALECTAHANQLDEGFLDEILNIAKAEISVPAVSEISIYKALGSLASGHGIKNQNFYEYLVDNLVSGNSSNIEGLQFCLSYTNMKAACKIIAENLDQKPKSGLLAISRMGTIALEVLTGLLETSIELIRINNDKIDLFADVISVIGKMNTPLAATKLAEFILKEDENIEELQTLAAWYLANLNKYSEIENHLRLIEFTNSDNRLKYIDWAWLPFESSQEKYYSILNGRIVHLISGTKLPSKWIKLLPNRIDPRLVVPFILCWDWRYIEQAMMHAFSNIWHSNLVADNQLLDIVRRKARELSNKHSSVIDLYTALATDKDIQNNDELISLVLGLLDYPIGTIFLRISPEFRMKLFKIMTHSMRTLNNKTAWKIIRLSKGSLPFKRYIHRIFAITGNRILEKLFNGPQIYNISGLRYEIELFLRAIEDGNYR